MNEEPEESLRVATNREREVDRELDRLRPAMEADGGGCHLVGIEEDGTVKIRLRGTCLACPSADLTLKLGIETSLKTKFPWVARVVRG